MLAHGDSDAACRSAEPVTGGEAVPGRSRPSSTWVLGTAALLATVVGALASGGRDRAITLLLLFAGLFLAGYLYGLHVRDQAAGGRRKRTPRGRRPD